MSGCSQGTPEDVAKEWLTALANQRYDDAKKYSTEATKAILTNDAPPKDDGTIFQKITITIRSVKTNGDEALVTYSTSDKPEEVKEPLKLVKKSNKWLVQM